MYTKQEERAVEKICYNKIHVLKVVDLISQNFGTYFKKYIEQEAGKIVSLEDKSSLSDMLGIGSNISKIGVDTKQKYKRITIEAIEDFSKDQHKYEAIFDKEALEEYNDDPSYFKSTVLKNECPIIHSTLLNKKAKELNKYRHDFSVSDAVELLAVVENLCRFALNYKKDIYNQSTYDLISAYEDLQYQDLDTEGHMVYGVIGGGIKSHMLYKVFPALFPNRSRAAIWALWYLTAKDSVGCEKDSEFLMIDVEKSITQQNYFYPYELFAFYAHQTFQMLNKEAKKIQVDLDLNYRYVHVDSFLSFIAEEHQEEVSLLKQQIVNGGYEYA